MDASSPVVITTEKFTFGTAAKDLVALKNQLDGGDRNPLGTVLARHLFPNFVGNSTIAPFTFADFVLPFFNSQRASFESKKGYKALVATSMVVGESWRWRPSGLDEDEKEHVIKKAFEDFEKSDASHAQGECASYSYIKPLGIVLAHEGKNRVALFREKDLPYIPAIVHDEGYPEAERIKIFEIGGECFAVLDDSLVEKVNGAYLAKPLLVTYGIKFESKWPGNYPRLERIRKAFAEDRVIKPYGTPVVDFSPLRLDEEIENTYVDVSIFDVNGIILPSWKLWAGGAGLWFVLLALAKFAVTFPILEYVLTFSLGALSVALIVPILPILKCKVKLLKERPYWHHRFEVRRQIESRKDGHDHS